MRTSLLLPVRRAATLAAALGLLSAAACRSGAVADPADGTDRSAIVAGVGSEVTLAPGATARIDAANLYVKFDALLDDSRCPTKALVQCVWAGSVRVRVLGSAVNGPDWIRSVELETAPQRDTATIGGQLVRLLRVTPERETLDSIPRSQYRIVLQVGARE